MMSVEWIIECQERAASHSASARWLMEDGGSEQLKMAVWYQEHAACYSAQVRVFLLREETRVAFEFFKEEEL